MENDALEHLKTKLNEQPLNEQTNALAQHLLEHLVRKDFEMPMLPDVASRVLAISNDPDSDAAQLAKLIQADQGLSGHVMRIANSAAYTPNASMVSLQQAIARLGMNLITEIALAASLNSKMFKAPQFSARLKTIWDHALASALWGKEVARISKKNVEAAFLCGLLHSIGRPIVLQTISEQLTKTNAQLSEEEARVLEDLFHVAYGAVIVENWGMPAIVQETVRCYETYQQAKTHKDSAMVIHAADKLAERTLVCQTQGLCEFNATLDDDVFADLNLYADEIEKLEAQKEKVVAGMEAMRS